MLRITTFEKARLIGKRATQIANGAKAMCCTDGMDNPVAIAEKEYFEGTIPLCIIRTLPDGTKIKVKIKPRV